MAQLLTCLCCGLSLAIIVRCVRIDDDKASAEDTSQQQPMQVAAGSASGQINAETGTQEINVLTGAAVPMVAAAVGGYAAAAPLLQPAAVQPAPIPLQPAPMPSAVLPTANGTKIGWWLLAPDVSCRPSSTKDLTQTSDRGWSDAASPLSKCAAAVMADVDCTKQMVINAAGSDCRCVIKEKAVCDQIRTPGYNLYSYSYEDMQPIYTMQSAPCPSSCPPSPCNPTPAPTPAPTPPPGTPTPMPTPDPTPMPTHDEHQHDEHEYDKADESWWRSGSFDGREPDPHRFDFDKQDWIATS